MKMNLKKGFTLIELLVVVAIIGILASVVLASLNSARAKGANAAIKANLSGIRAQAEIVYDNNNGSYAAVCADPNVAKAMTASNTASGGTSVCTNAAGTWVVGSPLKVAEGTSTWWCVDNTGTSKGTATAITTQTVCP